MPNQTAAASACRTMTRVNSIDAIAATIKHGSFVENVMNILRSMTAAALGLGLALCVAAFAADPMPEIKIFGGVSYVSGGIGLDEASALKAAEKDFSLCLLFAQTKRGEYVSDVKVSIADKAGKTVLDVTSDGPMLLAKLAPGTYKVSAEYEGKALSRSLSVAAAGVTRAGFVWQPSAKATIE